MPQQTKTIRVFISSTFTDMKLERSLLQKHVFPKLEKFCLLNHAKFQAVDLRWGVTEETQRNQKTLQTCLNEVARCQRISPKPNFLILLGDKYGWQPIPERIPEEEMDEILQVISVENKEVIFYSETDEKYKGWCRKDENAVPPEFVLQPRGKDHEEYTNWEPIENAIRKILRDAVDACNFSEAQRVKYFTSATHQEIINGALNLPAELEDPQKHVFAFVRNTRNLPKNKEAAGFIDLDEHGEHDTDAFVQLLQLKEELKETLQDNFIEYDAEWKNKTVELERTCRFLGKVYVRLKNVIKQQLESISDPDEITHEQRLHYDFKEKLVTHFRGREETLNKINDYLEDKNTNQILALIGESGSGKSSVMAKITDTIIEKEKNNNTVIAYRFLGTSSNSSNVISMMQSVAGQIARALSTELKDLTADGDEKALHEIYGMSEAFKKCLALATPEKPVVVFLDALDQLSDTDNARQLHWLPQELPPNVKLVVSSLPELEGSLSENKKLELPLLPEKEVNDILKTWLGSVNRKLTDKQFDEITRKEVSKLPIYLRIAFEQAKHWKSYHNYELSESVDGIIKDFINRLESEHVNGLVEHVICYMLCGRYQGLAENEILDILVFDDEFWEAFLKHTHKDHLEELKAAKKIPVAVWSRLYLDLEPFLTERDADGVPIITFFHRQFNEVLRMKCNSCNNNIRFWNKKIIFKSKVICAKCANNIDDKFALNRVQNDSNSIQLSMFFWQLPNPPINGFLKTAIIVKQLSDGDYWSATNSLDLNTGSVSYKIFPFVDFFKKIPCLRCNSPVSSEEYMEVSCSSPRANADGERFYLRVPFCKRCQDNIVYTKKGKQYRFGPKDYLSFYALSNFMLNFKCANINYQEQIFYNCKGIASILSNSLNNPDSFYMFLDKQRAQHPLFTSMYQEYFEETRQYLWSFRNIITPVLSLSVVKPTNEKIFVSYKSEDVAIARRIAEILILNGFNVWFNEYDILIDEYKNFKTLINKGLESTSKAICLTNNRYIESEYCNYEISQLFRSLSSKNIYEIRIPDEPSPRIVYPELKKCQAFVWNSSYVELFRNLTKSGFIDNEISFRNLDQKFHSNQKWFKHKDAPLLFNIANWNIKPTPKGVNYGTQFEDTSNQLSLEREVGDKKLFIHILFQKVKPGVGAEFIRDTNIDERKIFERNLFDTKGYMDLSNQTHNSLIDILGIHLFFCCGYSQYAFTYSFKKFEEVYYASTMRKYIISLPGKDEELEIVITANIHGTMTSLPNTKNDFLCYSQIFDEFVSSIKSENY